MIVSAENTRNEIHRPFKRVTEAWKWSFVLIFGRASPETEEGALARILFSFNDIIGHRIRDHNSRSLDSVRRRPNEPLLFTRVDQSTQYLRSSRIRGEQHFFPYGSNKSNVISKHENSVQNCCLRTLFELWGWWGRKRKRGEAGKGK